MFRHNRGAAFSRFFEDLSEGDPLAVALLIVLLVTFTGLGLFVPRVRQNLKREDEARANRWKKLG
jgi:hypothetical protein